MSSVIISTERLILRRWNSEDFIPFANMNKDPDVMEYFPNVLTNEETAAMMKRIEFHFEKYGFGVFALEEIALKTFIGFTGFMCPLFKSFFTPCVEIGWRLQKEYWGKGYATEAAKACLQYGFKTLQFEKIFSFTSKLNLRSEKVMQSIGMQKAGEFNHPNIAVNSSLRRHVLYKIEKIEAQFL